MSDEAVERRHRRAIRVATNLLERIGYNVLRLRNSTYDLTADQGKNIKKIRVCLDKALPSVIKEIEQSNGDAVYSREVWVYKTSPGKGTFEIKII